MLDLQELRHFASIRDILTYSAAQYPTKKAFSDPVHTITYQQLDQFSTQFASYLLTTLGMSPGDRLAIQLPNIVHYPIALYGALKAGMIVVNTNPLYTSSEIVHQFTDAGVKTLVVLDQLLPTHQNIEGQTPVEHIISVNSSLLESTSPNAESFAAALLAGVSPCTTLPTLHGKDIAFLQYTGGTTGPSKGAMLTHNNVLSNVLQTCTAIQHTLVAGEETMVVPLPLYHIYACALSSIIMLYAGAHSILVPNPRDINAFIQQIAVQPFTIFSGINTLFVALCQHSDFRSLDFTSLKLTISGGTALTQTAAFAWESETGCKVCEAYGMTEASPVITFNDPVDPRMGSIGKVLPDTQIRIVDEEGIDTREPGELWIKGAQVMMGYWNKPEETANTITVDGWLKTGDIVLQDDEGFIKIVDRKKDMVIVSGFNVYPTEIEDVICQHDDVLECGVIGLPCDKTGEKVAAFIVKKNPTLSEQAIIEHCSMQLTNYKSPKVIKFIEELPKTNVGKILRRELRNYA